MSNVGSLAKCVSVLVGCLCLACSSSGSGTNMFGGKAGAGGGISAGGGRNGTSSTAPAGVVGKTCTSDSNCAGLPDGYCPKAGVCTAECQSHANCGCPSGMTTSQIEAGGCTAECIRISSTATTGYCFRTCTSNSQCGGTEICDAVDRICVPDTGSSGTGGSGGIRSSSSRYAGSGGSRVGGASGSSTPGAAVGKACTSDSSCSALVNGYCPKAGVCTAECLNHSNCGCPSGMTTSQVEAGGCAAECIRASSTATTGYCFRVCSSNSQCDGGEYCDLSGNICVPATTSTGGSGGSSAGGSGGYASSSRMGGTTSSGGTTIIGGRTSSSGGRGGYSSTGGGIAGSTSSKGGSSVGGMSSAGGITASGGSGGLSSSSGGASGFDAAIDTPLDSPVQQDAPALDVSTDQEID